MRPQRKRRRALREFFQMFLMMKMWSKQHLPRWSLPTSGQGIFGSNRTFPKILEQWSKAKTAKEDEKVVKKIDLDKMDLVEKMSQITQVRQKRSASLTKNNAFMFQEKLAIYTPKKQEQTEEQKRIKEAILQVKTCIFFRKLRSKSARLPLQLMLKMCRVIQKLLTAQRQKVVKMMEMGTGGLRRTIMRPRYSKSRCSAMVSTL